MLESRFTLSHTVHTTGEGNLDFRNRLESFKPRARRTFHSASLLTYQAFALGNWSLPPFRVMIVVELILGNCASFSCFILLKLNLPVLLMQTWSSVFNTWLL